eukprot:1192688-Prorocentrum_minimum.AAC.3
MHGHDCQLPVRSSPKATEPRGARRVTCSARRLPPKSSPNISIESSPVSLCPLTGADYPLSRLLQVCCR